MEMLYEEVPVVIQDESVESGSLPVSPLYITGVDRRFKHNVVAHPRKEVVIYTVGTKIISWDVQSRQSVYLVSQEHPITALAITDDGRYLFSTDSGKQPSIVVWDLSRNKEIQRLVRVPSAKSVTVTQIDVSPNGSDLILVEGNSRRGNLVLFSISAHLTAPTLRVKYQSHSALENNSPCFNSCFFPSQENRIISLERDELKFWDINRSNSKTKPSKLLLVDRRSKSLSSSANFVQLATHRHVPLAVVVCKDGKVMLINSSGGIVRQLDTSSANADDLSGVVLSDKLICVGTENGRILQYEFGTLGLSSVIHNIEDRAFSQDLFSGRVHKSHDLKNSGVEKMVLLNEYNNLRFLVAVYASNTKHAIAVYENSYSNILFASVHGNSVPFLVTCPTLSLSRTARTAHFALTSREVLYTCGNQMEIVGSAESSTTQSTGEDEGNSECPLFTCMDYCVRYASSGDSGVVVYGDSAGVCRMLSQVRGSGEVGKEALCIRGRTQIESDDSPLCSVSISRDAKYLAAIHDNGSFYIYDASRSFEEISSSSVVQWKYEKRYPVPLSSFVDFGLRASSDSLLIVFCESPTVLIYGRIVEKGGIATLRKFKFRRGVSGFRIHSSGAYLVATAEDGMCYVFHLESGELRGDFAILPNCRIFDIDPSGLYAVMAGSANSTEASAVRNRVLLYEICTGKFAGHIKLFSAITSVSFSLSGTELLISDMAGASCHYPLEKGMQSNIKQTLSRLARDAGFWNGYDIHYTHVVQRGSPVPSEENLFTESSGNVTMDAAPVICFSPSKRRTTQFSSHEVGTNETRMYEEDSLYPRDEFKESSPTIVPAEKEASTRPLTIPTVMSAKQEDVVKKRNKSPTRVKDESVTVGVEPVANEGGNSAPSMEREELAKESRMVETEPDDYMLAVEAEKQKQKEKLKTMRESIRTETLRDINDFETRLRLYVTTGNVYEHEEETGTTRVKQDDHLTPEIIRGLVEELVISVADNWEKEKGEIVHRSQEGETEDFTVHDTQYGSEEVSDEEEEL